MAEYFKKDGDKFVEVTDKLHTQADVDNVIESRLERERKKFADYDTLKETAGKVDSIKSEYETKLKEKDTKLSEAEKLAGQAKLETVKVKTLHEFKLSDDLGEFLNGDDEKTIRSQAEKLSHGVAGGSVIIDKEKKPDGGTKSDTESVAKKLFKPGNSDD